MGFRIIVKVSGKKEGSKGSELFLKTGITTKPMARKVVDIWLRVNKIEADDIDIKRTSGIAQIGEVVERDNSSKSKPIGGGKKTASVYGKPKVLHTCPGCGKESHDKGAMVIHMRFCKKIVDKTPSKKATKKTAKKATKKK